MSGDERRDWGRDDRPRPNPERDVQDEIAFHMEMRIRENVARGMSPEEARAEAERRFGNPRRVQREMLAVGVRGGSPVGAGRGPELLRELSRAVRTLRRRPAFTAVTVLTLALGIGAATAVFSVANWLLLRTVAGVESPDSLITVTIATESSRDAAFFFDHPSYEAFQGAVPALSGLTASQVTEANVWLPGSDRPQRMTAAYVASDFSRVLGLRPLAGRTFTAEDRVEPHVALISDHLWATLYRRNPAAVGSTLTVNGSAVTVVGVAPADFRGVQLLGDTDLWIPVEARDVVLASAPADVLSSDWNIWSQMVGRLAPDATLKQAAEQLTAVATRLRSDAGGSLPAKAVARTRPGIGLTPWQRGQLSEIFRVLAGVVGLLLLLACANAANLLLARIGGRADELSIRRAIGAGHRRIMRLLVTEAGLVVCLAGVVGVGLAAGAVRLFRGERLLTFMPPLTGIELDGRVLLFTLVLSLATGLVFGVVPSLLASRRLGTVLRSGARSVSRRGPSQVLVMAQVAISVTLVVGAGLLLNTVLRLNHQELGFRPQGVLEASVDPGSQGYEPARVQSFFRELRTRVAALPGVQAAGLSWIPIQGRDRAGNVVRPEGLAQDDERAVQAAANQITPGFLTAVGVELIAGRDFRSDELFAEQGDVVIVSEAAAARMFPGGDALGRIVDLGYREPDLREIVGIVRDARVNTVKEAEDGLVFQPLGVPWSPTRATLYVRGQGDRIPDPGALHRLLTELDPALPFYDMQPLTRRVAGTLTMERVLARLTAVFAALALVLAAVGLYGMMAIAVQSRVREMGIRLALGARPQQVRHMVLRRGLLLTVAGVAVGLLASTQATRLIRSRLWGVGPWDPMVFGAAALVLLATAVVACWIPAARATRVDPVATLTEE